MDVNMEKVKFGQYMKIFVDDDIYNEGTAQEYFELHFNYGRDDETIDQTFVQELGEILQRKCNEKGYPVYVDINSAREINTIFVEVHNTKFRDEQHINESLRFIDALALQTTKDK